MHNENKRDALAEYLHEKLAPAEQPKPESVQREEARQAKLRQRAQSLNTWRTFVSKFEAGDLQLTGDDLRKIREASGLSLADVSGITGLPVESVEHAERGGSLPDFFARPLQQFAVAATNLNEEGGAREGET